MLMSKKALLFFLITSNLFWFYIIVDFGVKYTYQNDSLNSCFNNLHILTDIIPKVSGLKEGENVNAVFSHYEKKFLVFIKEGKIYIDNLGFYIQDNKIRQVTAD